MKKLCNQLALRLYDRILRQSWHPNFGSTFKMGYVLTGHIAHKEDIYMIGAELNVLFQLEVNHVD